jgi:NAD(P)-dependent dehydrogenase (short-subunit alcohol dehydrogenase family)
MRNVALITGGTRGIGLGIAKKLAQEGIDLALNGVRQESEISEVLDELRKSGVRVEYFQGNIAEKADRENVVNGVKEKFGSINFLINNAGVAPRVRADVLEIEEEDFDHLMDINLKGTFFLTQAFANWMAEIRITDAETPLSIVSITSVSAVLASTNRAAYCMAKAGLSMMTKVLAVRLAEFNIPVYEIQPGVIETDMTEKVKSVYQERIGNGLTLEKRMGQPEDIGKVVATLLRGDFPYATGQILQIEGGMTVGRL